MDGLRRMGVRHFFASCRTRGLQKLELRVTHAQSLKATEEAAAKASSQCRLACALGHWSAATATQRRERNRFEGKMDAVVQALNQVKQRRVFGALELCRRTAVVGRLKNRDAVRCFSRTLMRSCFHRWALLFLACKEKQKVVGKAVALWRATLSLKVLRRWRRLTRRAKKERRQVLAALRLWKAHRERFVWRRWIRYVSSRRQKKTEGLFALELHRKALVELGCVKMVEAAKAKAGLRLRQATVVYEAKATRELQLAAKVFFSCVCLEKREGVG
jgi:hypothetical protein